MERMIDDQFYCHSQRNFDRHEAGREVMSLVEALYDLFYSVNKKS